MTTDTADYSKTKTGHSPHLFTQREWERDFKLASRNLSAIGWRNIQSHRQTDIIGWANVAVPSGLNKHSSAEPQCLHLSGKSIYLCLASRCLQVIGAYLCAIYGHLWKGPMPFACWVTVKLMSRAATLFSLGYLDEQHFWIRPITLQIYLHKIQSKHHCLGKFLKFSDRFSKVSFFAAVTSQSHVTHSRKDAMSENKTVRQETEGIIYLLRKFVSAT